MSFFLRPSRSKPPSAAPSLRSSPSDVSLTPTTLGETYEAENGEEVVIHPDADDSVHVRDGETQSEGSKVKQLLGILKKMLGVSDLAAVRLSLPSNLLEPVGNLEYWCYTDRPDIFTMIGESDDEVERMMEIVRWTMTKELKFIRGGIVKPYNSVLGEHFRCYWDSAVTAVDPQNGEPIITEGYRENTTDVPSTSTSSVASFSSSATNPSPVNSALDVNRSSTSLGSTGTETTLPSRGGGKKARTVFLTEQICHHPPISAFWYEGSVEDGARRVECYGIDQISARFTGTSLKIFPGSKNQGIFINLPERGNEEYQITHPVASIVGIVKLSPYVTITEQTSITRRRGENKSGKQLRAITHYLDEGWISRPRFALKGVVYEYTNEIEEAWTMKDVPADRIVASFEGSWRSKITWKRTRGDDRSERVLVDLDKLEVLPKTVRSVEKQHEMESRKIWQPVTDSIKGKKFAEATKHKQIIEQKQRDKAEEKKRKNEEHIPVFFSLDINNGRPKLTDAGKKALDDDMKAIGYEVAHQA